MMVLIFVLSSISRLPSIPGGLDDSVAHALEYAVLAALLLRGLVGTRWREVTIGAAGLAVVLATLYGLTDEVHQRFVPGRAAQLTDVVADALGATVAAGLVLAWQIVVQASRGSEDR